MNRKILIRVTVVALSAMFGLALPTMNVLAAEDTTEAVIVNDGSQKVVGNVSFSSDGSEESGGFTAVSAEGENSEVTANSVVASISGESVWGEPNTGYAVKASDGGRVNVTQDVSYTEEGDKGEAVNVIDGTVSVGGKVDSSGDGIVAEGSLNASEVQVVGNVTAGNSAIKASSSDVKVGGNVVGNNGIEIMPSNGYAGSVIVNGTVKATGDDGYGVLISAYAASTEGLAEKLPEITVYQFDVSSEEKIVGASIGSYDDEWNFIEMSDEDKSSVVETVKNAINYIIKADDQVLRENGVKIDGTTMTMADTVSIALAGGYALDKNNSSNITIVSEENGTIKIRLSSALGGTYIKAIQQAAQEAAQESGKNESGSESNESSKGDENSQGSGDASGNVPSNNDNGNVRPVNIIVEIIPAEESVQESADQSESAPSSDKYGAPEGTIKLTTGNASAPIAPAIEGAAAPARTVSLKVTELTSAQFQNAIVDSIASTPAGATLRIETDTAACFDRKMLESFATRSNIDVEVLFTYNGKKRRVVIPAGFDISKLLDEKGYCGFLRLADILGSQVIG